MSIEKKSLISTLKTTKKATIARETFEPEKVASKLMPVKVLTKTTGKVAASASSLTKITAKIV